jgi:hypothetical protein
MVFVHRFFAVALSFILLPGNAAVCRGWAVTPEARMACCAEGGACPMHKGESSRSRQAPVVTQAQADSCCAAGEREHSSQSSPAFYASITQAVLGTATVLPIVAPSLVLSDGWRTTAPIPTGPIPRHVLLSVFLV